MKEQCTEMNEKYTWEHLGEMAEDLLKKDLTTSVESLICRERKKGLLFSSVQFSSVQISHSVMSDSLQPNESQHARPPCPSPTPGVHSDSCPSSR